jgi:mannose-1-phosphate guanylyltransferase
VRLLREAESRKRSHDGRGRRYR